MTHPAYWITTALTAFALVADGVAYLAHADFATTGIAALGYPVYVVTLLGAAKLLGGIAIVAPRLPRLKEWAYAGIAFDLAGAAISHVAVGDPLVKPAIPLALLAVAMASYALRPASRRLG